MKTQPEQPVVTSAAPSSDEVAALREENAALKHRVAWFERQLFGQKSEKRPVNNLLQASLLGEPAPAIEPEGETVTVSYSRRKQRPDDCVNDSGLRFSDKVPVQIIEQSVSSNDGCNSKEQDIEQWIEGLGALASVVNVGQVLGKDIKAHDLGRKLGI